jgi:hypothetical protein
MTSMLPSFVLPSFRSAFSTTSTAFAESAMLSLHEWLSSANTNLTIFLLRSSSEGAPTDEGDGVNMALASLPPGICGEDVAILVIGDSATGESPGPCRTGGSVSTLLSPAAAAYGCTFGPVDGRGGSLEPCVAAAEGPTAPEAEMLRTCEFEGSGERVLLRRPLSGELERTGVFMPMRLPERGSAGKPYTVGET